MVAKAIPGAVFGAVILATTLAACAASPNRIGPLGGPEAEGSVCMSDVHTTVLTDGWPAVRNTSQTPAVIDKVDMADPRGLRLLKAWAVPVVGHDLYGAEPGYPPGKVDSPGILWDQRHTANGAVVRHSTGLHQTDLLFVVRLLTGHASASGVDIWYHVGHQRYHIRTVFGLKVLSAGSGNCPS